MTDIQNRNIEVLAAEGAKKVQGVANNFLVLGILNIVVGVIATALGFFWAIFSILLGIWELINAIRYRSTPPKSNNNPIYIGILEIINVVCGPIWSLIVGIANLNQLKSPEVKAYFAALENGTYSSLLPTSLSTNLKKCPNCAETIKADALVCRFCNKQFSEEDIQQAKLICETNAQKIEYHLSLKKKQSKINIRSFWGWFLRIIGLLFAFILLILILVYLFPTIGRKPLAISQLIASSLSIIIVCIIPSILGSFSLFKKANKIKVELKLMEADRKEPVYESSSKKQ